MLRPAGISHPQVFLCTAGLQELHQHSAEQGKQLQRAGVQRGPGSLLLGAGQ